MADERHFLVRSFFGGLWQIFRSSPLLALGTLCIILGISSVIPLAFLWLIQSLFWGSSFIHIQSSLIWTIVTVWSAIEVIFFFYQVYLYSKIQTQSCAPPISNAERDRLVSFALANIKDLQTTLSRWFLGLPFAQIDRHSIVGWLAFAFFSKHIDQLNTDEYQQIDSFIEKIETDHQLKATVTKSDKKLLHMRHILDPVRVIFRPFAFYFVTDTLLQGLIGSSIFYLRGYRFVQMGHLQFWTYYQPSDDAMEEDPIIFFHGLGSGLLFYQPFIGHLHRRFSRNRRLIFISMRCIALRYPSLDKIPNMTETADSIALIFKHYRMKKAVFIGHSYGTACLSWIVKKCPEYISKLIFVDPICFALFEPFVVYNFVYRTPAKLAHLYMYYFVCREMGISYVVSRHFWWTQNNLYLEQLRSCTEKPVPVLVLLAGRDCIINSRLVRDYLVDDQIECHWTPNLFHGSYLHDESSWEKISQWIS